MTLLALRADPEVWSVLFQIVALLAVALALAIVFERLKQSAILGYLTAGTLLGPGVLGVVDADSGLPVIAELGVSLLLFAIGLEFSVSRLMALGRVAIQGGSAQILATLGLGTAVALGFGAELRTAVAVGAVVALSSTACVLRLLIDRAELDSVHGRSALGILLMQDVAVVPLVLLVTVLGGEGGATEMGVRLVESILVVLVLVVAFRIVLTRLLPRVLARMNFTRDRELLVLLAAVLALGSASAAHAVEVSPALGAFVAGIMLADCPFAMQIRSDVGALRVLFVTLFFASVGMLGDPSWIVAHAPQVAGATALVLVGKAAVVALVVRWAGVPTKHAVATGVALSQVGEFGVVIAGIAGGNGLMGDDLFQLLVSATLIALFATPFLVRIALPIGALVARGGPAPTDAVGPGGDGHGEAPEVFLVGFGPSGQEVGSELSQHGTPALVLDLAPANVELARSLGLRAAVGDGASPETLLHHGFEHARVVVVTIPDHVAARQVVAAVRTLAPAAEVIVRARYHRFANELERCGAAVVVDEEQQTGRRMAAAVRALLVGS